VSRQQKPMQQPPPPPPMQQLLLPLSHTDAAACHWSRAAICSSADASQPTGHPTRDLPSRGVVPKQCDAMRCNAMQYDAIRCDRPHRRTTVIMVALLLLLISQSSVVPR
jgi:hypothetical protein